MAKNIQINYNNGNGYEVLHPESNPNIVGCYSKSEVDNKIDSKLKWVKFRTETVTPSDFTSGNGMKSIFTNSITLQEDFCFMVTGNVVLNVNIVNANKNTAFWGISMSSQMQFPLAICSAISKTVNYNVSIEYNNFCCGSGFPSGMTCNAYWVSGQTSADKGGFMWGLSPNTMLSNSNNGAPFTTYFTLGRLIQPQGEMGNTITLTSGTLTIDLYKRPTIIGMSLA